MHTVWNINPPALLLMNMVYTTMAVDNYLPRHNAAPRSRARAGLGARIPSRATTPRAAQALYRAHHLSLCNIMTIWSEPLVVIGPSDRRRHRRSLR